MYLNIIQVLESGGGEERVKGRVENTARMFSTKQPGMFFIPNFFVYTG